MTTDTYFTIFKWMLYFGTLLVAVGTIGTSVYSAKVDELKDQKIDELLDGNKQLQLGNLDLNKKVDKYQSDLSAKQHEIDILTVKAAKAERGEYVMWEFTGTRREAHAGQMNVTAGIETAVFQKLFELEKLGKHEDIVRIATEQISKTHDWLTPYLFRGTAYANLGQLDKAVKDLDWVVKKAQGDQKYAKAAITLDKIRHQVR